MSTKPFRAYDDDLNKLKGLAATSGKSEKDILHEILDGAPEDFWRDVKETIRAKTRKRSTQEITPSYREPEDRRGSLSSRLKRTLEDGMEARILMQSMGMDLGMQQNPTAPNQQAPPWWMQQQMQQQPKKQMGEIIAEIKMIESIGGDKAKTDPAVVELLKELKNQTLDQRKQKPRTPVDEMMEMAKVSGYLRMMGQNDKADTVQNALLTRLDRQTEQRHTQDQNVLQQIHSIRYEALQKKLQDIATAPSEFDRITEMSKLANTDPAIRAYMNTRLGIKSKEPLTPQKLKEYIESVEVPVGKIIGQVYKWIQGRGAAEEDDLIPPETAPPESFDQEEQQLAQRVAPSLLPKGVGSHTIPVSQPEDMQPPTTTRPEETHLPPEPEGMPETVEAVSGPQSTDAFSQDKEDIPKLPESKPKTPKGGKKQSQSQIPGKEE